MGSSLFGAVDSEELSSWAVSKEEVELSSSTIVPKLCSDEGMVGEELDFRIL